MNEDRLMEFVYKFVGDLGATMGAGGVVVGDRLGLFKALADKPLRPHELAERTGTAARYVEEWLRGQAAGGYVECDAVTGEYSLTEQQAFALTDPDGPIFAPGAFQLALGALKAEPAITEAFRTGEGFGWHKHDADVFAGCERFFRPGYAANLVDGWLPALDGVVDKLSTGIRVADVGCGYGASTILMAKAFPRSVFAGSDYHDLTHPDADEVRTKLRPHLNAAARQPETPTPKLTPRQREVLTLVRQGLTNHAIASRLAVSTHTVRKHLENAFARLGVNNRTAAVTAFADSQHGNTSESQLMPSSGDHMQHWA